MTHHHTETRLDVAESTRPALPESEASLPGGSLPESHHPSLQSTFGNSLLAAAAISGAPTDPAEILPLHAGFGNTAVSRTLIQRKANNNGASPTSSAAMPGAPAEGPGARAPGQGLIVDDEADTVQPGQMKKSAFLGQLRSAVNTTVTEVSAGAPLPAEASSEIEKRFAQASGLNGQQLEQAIRSQVPEAAGATSAAGFIPPIIIRVRRMVEQGMSSTLPGVGGVLGAIGSAVSSVVSGVAGVASKVAKGVGGAVSAVAGGVRSAVSTVAEGVGSAASAVAGGVGSAVSAVTEGVGSAISAVGDLLFKGREGGAKSAGDPRAIQSQLGEGQSLESGVRSRMESAFGEDFSDVQVHADTNAGGLSANLNARAFTVGQHVAFGTGEYRPGTLIGDALIAHELAHTIQQGSGSGSEVSTSNDTSPSSTLEQEADEAAAAALKGGKFRVGRGHRLKLGLQRCGLIGLGGFSPSLFVFRTVIPNPTPGTPGGWQETGVVPLKFVDGRTSNSWTCTVKVGVPIENFRGSVDPTLAASSAAAAATSSSSLVMHSRPAWLGSADYCPPFRAAMEAELKLAIPGARVTAR